MVAPPLLAGSVQLTVAEETPALAVTFDGASGTVTDAPMTMAVSIR
jgi:hypothetical protein